MDEVLVERIFSEIDTLAKSVTKLSEIVHKDNILLNLVHKIVFVIVLAMVTGAISFGWYQLQKEPSKTTEVVHIHEKQTTGNVTSTSDGTLVIKKK